MKLISSLSIRISTLALSALALVALSSLAIAQTAPKHPRVAELEDKLSRDAGETLRSRYPSVPYFALVMIEPLRRIEGGREAGQSEQLPFLEIEKEEIQDEWDDPSISAHRLLSRVRKISVVLQLPDTLNDNEVNEVKDTVFQALHLMPVRDELKIDRKPWKQANNPVWLYGAFAVGAALLLVIGFIIVSSLSSRRIATAIAESKSGGSGGTLAPAPLASTNAAGGGEKLGHGSDVRFSDPIKIRELLLNIVGGVSELKGFPTLLDMITLDQLGKKDSAALGAILMEFTDEERQRIFSLSYEAHWLEALAKPGNADLSSLDVLREILRHPHGTRAVEFENLLIYVWRLGDIRGKFLRDMPQEVAFAILSEMPKGIAVEIARKAFPGNWAGLLDPDFKPKAPSLEKCVELSRKALEAKALSDLAQLDRYRQDMELLHYLRESSVQEEREVYGAAREDSLIHSIRPPFFKALELSPAVAQDLVARFTPEVWAKALAGVPKSERSVIEAAFSEKQRFLFLDMEGRVDGAHLDRQAVGALREQIARAAVQVIKVHADQGKADAGPENANWKNEIREAAMRKSDSEKTKKKNEGSGSSESGQKAA